MIHVIYAVLTLCIAHSTYAHQPCAKVGLSHAHYNDIVINGKVICTGYGQSCESRYIAIQQVANQYTRPFTVLEIGPSEGYISLQLAHHYDATCVMVQDPSYNNDVLNKLCRLNTQLHNLVLLSKRITVEELEQLAKCEHVDMVIAMNVVHHYDTHWQRVIDALLQLGDNIIIETPPAQTTDTQTANVALLPYIQQYLEQQNGSIIAQTPRWSNPALLANTYWFQRQKNALQTTSWYNLHPFPANYTIHSNWHTKELQKIINGRSMVTPWKKGINLITFKMLNGTFPTKEKVAKLIMNMRRERSSDCLPHNMVIQGDTIALIDCEDPRCKTQGWPCSRTCTKVAYWVKMTNDKKLRDYFIGVLATMPRVTMRPAPNHSHKYSYYKEI
ncbi:MAG: class I SAM-dependent methyltransferase [Candidatus Babeliales bacterium]